MKLKTKEFNNTVSYVIGKMDARMNGIPLDESITIQVADKDFGYSAKTGIRKDNGQPYRISSIIGKVISGNVSNVVYNQYDNAKFEFSDAIDKYFEPLGPEGMRGKVIDIKLVEKDGAKGKFMVFEVGIINDDGSKTPLTAKNGSGSSNASSSLPPPPLPPAIEQLHKEISVDKGIELTDVEKIIFKTVRINPDWKAWGEHMEKGIEEFKLGLKTVCERLSYPLIEEERQLELFKKYLG